MHTSGYLHVVPNSHFYDSIGMIINAIQTLDWSAHNFYEQKEYVLVGLHNTKNRGYELLPEDPGAETEEVCDALEYCGRECPGINKCGK